MGRKHLSLLAVLAALPAPALSQSLPGESGVQSRPHPEYDPSGIHAGGFTLLPSLTGSVDATDNYRATHDNRKSVVTALLRPDLTFRSNWTRHRLNGDVYAQQTVHTTLPKENAFTYGGRLNGALEPSHDSEIDLNLEARRDVEDRRYLDAFTQSSRPVFYTLLHADASAAKTFGNLEFLVNGGVEKRTYGDAILDNGTRYPQRFRDYDAWNVGVTGEYRFDTGIGLLVSATHSKTNFLYGPGDPGYVPGVSLDRDATGDSITAGIVLELSHLVFGTIRAGYMHHSFADPRLKAISAPTYEANILWNVTPLTTITAYAHRYVSENSTLNSGGFVRNDFALQVDHELYRNVLLTGRAEAVLFRSVGVHEHGTEYHVSAGARYLMNRSLSFHTLLRYDARDTNGSFLERYHSVDALVGFRYAI